MKVYPNGLISVRYYSDAFAVAGPAAHVPADQFKASLLRQNRLTGRLPATTMLGLFDFEDYRLPVDLMDVAWHLGVVPQLIVWPHTGLHAILSGEYDATLRQRARELRDWSQGGRYPLVLQFCTEVNLDYYAWCGAQNGGWDLTAEIDGHPWPAGPARYVEAHRRVWRLFTEEGVEASWHWQSFLEWQGREANHAEWYYPGEHYNDSVGVGMMLEPGNEVFGTFRSGYEASMGELRRVQLRYGLTKPTYLEVTATVDPGDPDAKPRFFTECLHTDYSADHQYGFSLGFWDSVNAVVHDTASARRGGVRPVPKFVRPARLAADDPDPPPPPLPVNAKLAIDTTAASAAAFRAGIGQEWYTDKGRLA